ncbi:MAG: hypothetical protein H3C47_06335 [Candidatus Cloacimonetes bacterium]|nr:hypothetical protein [Candidatus Cloacimonadota bacterium]
MALEENFRSFVLTVISYGIAHAKMKIYMLLYYLRHLTLQYCLFCPIFALSELRLCLERQDFYCAESRLDSLKQLNGNQKDVLRAEIQLQKALWHDQNKDYRNAVFAVEKAHAIQPENIQISVRLATAYLRNHDFYEAISIIERIRSRLGVEEQIMASLILAQAWMKLENYNAALNELRHQEYQSRQSGELYSLMAICYIRTSQPESALDVFSRKEKNTGSLSSEDQRLKHQAQQNIRLREKYTTAVSSSFRVVMQANGNSEALRIYLDILDRAYMDVGRVLDYYPKNYTRVLFLNREDFVEYTSIESEAVAGLHDGASLDLLIPWEKISQNQEKSRLENVIYHEYTHHLLNLMTKQSRNIPLWVHEGLAQFLEPHQDMAVKHQILKPMILQANYYRQDMPENVSLHSGAFQFYAQAHSMIQFASDKGWLPSLVSQLPLLRADFSFADLFVKSTGLKMNEFIETWAKTLGEIYAD